MTSAPRLLRADEVTFTIEALDCDLDVYDELSECYPSREEITAMLNACGLWGWCEVKVTARWGRWSGIDYLCGCSYESERDFLAANDYAADMKETALSRLNDEIANAFRTFDSLMVST